MSKTEPNRALQNAKYSFDSARNAWFCGKKPIEEEEILIKLIKSAKSQNIRNAGEYAERELNRIKQSPETTARVFAKKNIVRNRNNRMVGKYLFARWCGSVGIEIVGKLEEFMVRNSLLVARFYNELSAIFGSYKKQARVLGKVSNSVFFGIDIRVFTDFKPVDTPKMTESSQSHKFDGLRRHLEFISKDVCG